MEPQSPGSGGGDGTQSPGVLRVAHRLLYPGCRPVAGRGVGCHPPVHGDGLVNPDQAAALIERRLPADWGQGWPHVWLGTTCGVRGSYPRLDALRNIPAAVRFISAEPLLESLADINLDGFHWLIAGGESGSGFRPMRKDGPSNYETSARGTVSDSTSSSIRPFGQGRARSWTARCITNRHLSRLMIPPAWPRPSEVFRKSKREIRTSLPQPPTEFPRRLPAP